MANGNHCFSIRRNRLMQGLCEGFDIAKGGRLLTMGGGTRHSIILPGLDSAIPDCPWGRLAMDSTLTADGVLSIRVVASNEPLFVRKDVVTRTDSFLLDPGIEYDIKERFFTVSGGKRFDGSTDLLLYGITGRYLWIWLELAGDAVGELSNLRAYVPGDNFYRTLPQVYQNQSDDFFHRYLSIFSTIYGEQQDLIDSIPKYLDADTAPARFLPLFAQWMGLQLDGNFLDEELLRRLVKALPELLAVKGTRQAIEGVVRLLVSVPFSVVEYNLLENNSAEQHSIYGYGPFDFTVLINQKVDTLLRARLHFLIRQLSPVRSRCNIVFLNDCVGLDAFNYLDINASLMSIQSGALDEGNALTGIAYLQ